MSTGILRGLRLRQDVHFFAGIHVEQVVLISGLSLVMRKSPFRIFQALNRFNPVGMNLGGSSTEEYEGGLHNAPLNSTLARTYSSGKDLSSALVITVVRAGRCRRIQPLSLADAYDYN
jgi:hypothetical protein